MRFHPPTVAADPALVAVLRLAFSSVEPAALTGPRAAAGDPTVLASLISRLDLGARIAARHDAATLECAVGPALAADLRSGHRATVAQELALSAAAARVEALAGERGIPVVWLKFEALRRGGFLLAGARRAGDVDALVPPDRIRELQEALLADGCRDAGFGEKEHQLALLVHRGGAGIELHRLILGLRPAAAERSWELPDLRERGLLRPLEPLAASPPAAPQIFRPSRRALAAHLVVHGIAHHGDAPHTYPGLRMLGDLQDLGAEPAWVEPIGEWLGASLERDEVQAALGLASALAEDPEACLRRSPDSGPEAVLLHHLLAGALDERYRKALRFRLLQRPLSDRSPLAATWATAVSTLFPSRAQIDAIYGRPRGAWGYWGRRLARPFDLMIRAARYTWNHLKMR